MAGTQKSSETFAYQFRLFLEELCCDLCRFEHLEREGCPADRVRINRDFYLGVPGAFADIRVKSPALPPYFIEVKLGYADDALVRRLRHKYGKGTPALEGASKVVLLVDTDGRGAWPALEKELAGSLAAGLQLEVWNLPRFLALLQERFGVKAKVISESNLVDLRNSINHAKGFHAFGGKSAADYALDGLQASLLWHFGFWRLRELRQQGLAPRDILPPRRYQGVVILMADLCAFSSYVRDTPDDAIMRDSLTSFYSKARYQIINNGGMLSQFIGDEAVGLFGIPDHKPGSIEDALDAARGLVDIGNAVSNHWQRAIDRVQDAGGVHIGIAVGDLEAVSMQPFGRSPMGVIGDSINMAARLMASAGPGEIAVSNAFYRELNEQTAACFTEMEPLELRNIGRIKSWRLAPKHQGWMAVRES